MPALTHNNPRLALICLALSLTACGGGGGIPSDGGTNTASFADAQRAQCIKKSPFLEVGKGIDAPSNTLAIKPATVGASVGKAGGDCSGNKQFRFGSGLHDITGPVANTNGMGWENPEQVLSGLQQRQYARAFVIESPCNGKRILFMSTDTGMVFGSMRFAVLEAIANDPDLAAHYGPENVMISATHTHQGPGGYAHHEAFNFLHYGFDQLVLDTIANGMIEAIRLAHANIEAHPQTAPIGLAVGELLNTNINRSLFAFEQNNEAERNEFLNKRGEQVTNDKRFVQLNLVRNNSSAVGVINWFGVHPTIIGPELNLVSSDMKGYASQGFERIMRTDYNATPGPDNFVAAFAQKDEGDASPNIFILERPHPDPTRGGGKDPYESSAISGTKHLAKALELFQQGTVLKGPVDYRFFHVKMDEVTVTDPVVLASLEHPPELDTPDKRTCVGAMGVSFGAGAEDGPGFSSEGVTCNDDPDVIQAAADDFMTGSQGLVPPNIASTAVLCNVEQQPLIDLACHAEKPILLVFGPPVEAEANVLPLQLFRVGNLAILGTPWEVTTMSARRIQKLLFPVLAPIGIDTIVIAGLANEYANYLTTREEYAVQHYEGASTLYGPWSLAAVQQETRRLARSMADGTPLDPGPDYIEGTPRTQRSPYSPSDTPAAGTSFGDLITDVPATAAPGETVRAEFQSGHPRNDLRVQSSYVYVEKLNKAGEWEAIYTDKDPELWFEWLPEMPSQTPTDPAVVGPSTAAAIWHIPADTPKGTYRLRHTGAAQTTVAPLEQFEGVSSAFTVAGPVANCP